MNKAREFASNLGVKHAVVLAPMGGGISTPELVAAVSNAGGLGSFGAGYLAPEEITKTIARIRSLTSAPFAINLFAGGPDGTGIDDPSTMITLLAPIHEQLGIAAPVLTSASPPKIEEQSEAVLGAEVAVFSFTFGIPSRAILDEFRRRGVKLIGTATNLAEARALEDAGVDAIVAQGSEAGAHRGTFIGKPEDSLIGTAALVPQIADAVSVPVLASGGIMDGRGVAAAIALGASAVQMGTAFMLCPEAGTPAAHREAIRSLHGGATVLTRAFSGRMARGIPNRFIEMTSGHERSFLAYPRQNGLTRPMRTAAAAAGNRDFMSLWAGQGASMARAIPAGELVEQLATETDSLAGEIGVRNRSN